MEVPLIELRKKFALSALLAQILAKLVEGETIYPSQLYEVSQVSGRKTMDRLRRKLEEHGIEVRSQRNLGYWLEDSDQKLIRDMVERRDDGEQ